MGSKARMSGFSGEIALRQPPVGSKAPDGDFQRVCICTEPSGRGQEGQAFASFCPGPGCRGARVKLTIMPGYLSNFIDMI